MGYEEEIKEARRRQNNLNRQRSRNMELRVMRRLNGHRVPMSGSGQMKGDGIVQSVIGMYLVECKFSAQQIRYNEGGSIRFDYAWAAKLQREVKAMRARFGIFVIHFYQNSRDYVLMQESYFRLLAPHIDIDGLYAREKDEKFAYLMTQKRAALGLAQSRPYVIQSTHAVNEVGRVLVMELTDFEALLEKRGEELMKDGDSYDRKDSDSGITRVL